MERSVVLALETGLGGGSISLFKCGKEIDFWRGEAATASKAENLLIRISALLVRNNLGAKDIEAIFVSEGPGSFTGLRVGAATAKGLQKSLDCKYHGVYVLEAVVRKAAAVERLRGNVAAVVSAGEGRIWRQIFSLTDSEGLVAEGEVSKTELKSLSAELEGLGVTTLLLEEEVFKSARRMTGDLKTGQLKFIRLTEPLSRFIGLWGIERFSD